jgi:hypothetical protein
MKLVIRGFITHKENETYADCADFIGYNAKNLRFAISDGVSISFFPELWSKILVKEFLETDNLQKMLTKAEKEWAAKVENIVKGENISWYIKKKYKNREYAAATFVGICIENGYWKSINIGDSFLLFIPKNCKNFQQIIGFPNPSEYQFDNHPDYLASIHNIYRGKPLITSKEKLSEGTFYLLTDAMAEWFINTLNYDIELAEITLKHIDTQEQFIETIDRKREQGELKNDDSSLLIIEVIDDKQTEIRCEIREFINLEEMIEKENTK